MTAAKGSSSVDYGFDTEIDRSATFSSKWEKYAGRDILPYWVADMEFPTPYFVLDAVRARLEHPILGYTRTPPDFIESFQGWLQRAYGWAVPAEWLVWIPGVVTGFNLAALAAARLADTAHKADPGTAILIPTPVYYPFLSVPRNTDQQALSVPLVRDGARWCMDFDAMQDALDQWTGAPVRLLLLSNPQNPTGRAYTRAELSLLADFCLRNNLVLCSDEIHSPIILDEQARHIPVASLSQTIAERTITLFAATKTYNMPGLSCGVAVIPDLALRRAFIHSMGGLVPGIGPLNFAASQAAFADQSDYLPELLAYLRGNHRRVQEVVGNRMTAVEATYLAWIDLSDTPVAGGPGTFFESHGLGLSDGAPFGGPGFVRFNFACPRSMLERGLDRYQAAMSSL
ncbi:MAG: PatB family C-S lyase [Pseudomonadales bacterium]